MINKVTKEADEARDRCNHLDKLLDQQRKEYVLKTLWISYNKINFVFKGSDDIWLSDYDSFCTIDDGRVHYSILFFIDILQ